MLNLEEVDHPLFSNPRCDRKLSLDARRTLVDALTKGGGAEWLGSGRTRCVVLWRSVASWGEAMHAWACEDARSVLLGSGARTVLEAPASYSLDYHWLRC